eukprot:m.31398 g.31398  ORF g.31398 m.31398 type:complete len:160 (-) comp16451_c0_seq1:72-551(-)
MAKCYLTFEDVGSGTLFINWKAAPDTSIKALAVFSPTKSVPKFKFNSNGGKAELTRQCGGGVKIKDFYRGVAEFVKLAYSFQADLEINKQNWPNPVAVYLSQKIGSKVIKIEVGKEFKALSDTQAVAVVHVDDHHLQCDSLEKLQFLNMANSRGASLAF